MENPQQKYKVWWDEKEKIGRINVAGETNTEITEKIIEEGFKLAEQYGNKIGWLVDATGVTKPILTIQARKAMSEAIKLIGQGKLAIAGESTLVRVITNFVLTAVGKKNVKFFLTEEEALKWLKEE